MKKTIWAILLTLLCIPSLFAATSETANESMAVDGLYERGIYIGGQMGYVDPNNDHANYSWAKMFFPIFTQTGTRLYAGYAFNDYLAAELGYNFLLYDEETGGWSRKDNHSRMSAVDLFGKASLPLTSTWSLFAKLGFAYVNQDLFESIHNRSVILYDSDVSRLLFAISPGVDFHITSHLAVNGFFTYMFGRREIKSIDFFGLGIQYTF